VLTPAKLIDGSILLDQSMLTGESVSIEAGPGLQSYAGALVRRGEATATVTATGANTKFGHITATENELLLAGKYGRLLNDGLFKWRQCGCVTSTRGRLSS
jgi:hypothetical protein